MNLIDTIAHDVQTGHRAGRMLEALIASENTRAKVVLTTELTSAEGKSYHQTFRIKAWTGRNGSRMLTVSVEGSGSWAEGVQEIRVMHIALADRQIRDGRDARATPLLRYAAEAAVGFAWLGEAGLPVPTNGSVRVVEESTCGSCGRKLTDPVSIDRGIGPECAAKATGTKTILAVTHRSGRDIAAQGGGSVRPPLAHGRA